MSELPPKSPRFKKKGAPPRAVVQHRISADATIEHEIPDDIKVWIATAIMAFNEMEMCADHFLWDVLNISSDDGKFVFTMDAKDTFFLAKKLSDKYKIPIHSDADQAVEIWSTIHVLIEHRNKLAHGVWKLLDDKPIAISYRISTEPGTVNSEHFSLDKLRAISRNCRFIRDRFTEMSNKTASLPPTPPRQPRTGTSTRPEHPVPKG
jgi:hypothetical protein